MSSGQAILLCVLGISIWFFGIAPALVYLIGRIIRFFDPHSILIPDDYYDAVDSGFLMLVFVCIFGVLGVIVYAIIKFW